MVAVTSGCIYSARREVARQRHDPDRLADLLAGVLGAKAALTILSIAVAVTLSVLVAPVHHNESLLWPALLWALSMSYSLNWLFQGLERMAFIARWETGARILSLAGILLFVPSPADTWEVLPLHGGTLAAAVAIE